MDRLNGKVALISGGARGQGAAEARLFAGESAKLVVGDVLDDQCRRTAADINEKAGSKTAVAVHLVVTRAANWRAEVEWCKQEFGGLDVLVNNTSILNVKRIEDTSEEEWDSIVNINQKGVWLGMKAAVPAMRQRRGGSIINISSVYRITVPPACARIKAPKGRFAS
jgi:NAD(P)-dependent dehydrogenase (short-subunit alcohol dehydrogenase family)